MWHAHNTFDGRANGVFGFTSHHIRITLIHIQLERLRVTVWLRVTVEVRIRVKFGLKCIHSAFVVLMMLGFTHDDDNDEDNDDLP